MSYPDYHKPFRIHTDASDEALGGALTQLDGDIERPIAYYSRKLNPAEGRYTTTEKEALAIVASVKHFAVYVYGYIMTIFTDHCPLRYIFKYNNTVPRITRWVMLLAEFDYKVNYKPGKEHILPDTLSRTVAAIDTQGAHPNKPPDPARVFGPDLVKRAQGEEEGIREIIPALTDKGITRLDPHLLERYTLDQECLYFMEQVSNEQDRLRLRLVVPNSLVTAAFQIGHDSALGGHYEVSKTLYRARELFFWPDLAGDVKRYVASCTTCQKRNYQGARQAKFRSLSLVSRPLEHLGMDLIGPLATTLKKNRYILTIVCHFSRFVQGYALPNKESKTVTQAFFDYACCYSVSEQVVTDRGCEFTAATSKDNQARLGTSLQFTSSYHPQSNGMAEAANKNIKRTLHAMVQEELYRWDEQLPCAILALNCSYHPAINNTPYYLFFGRDAPLPYSRLLDRRALMYDSEPESPEHAYTRMQRAFEAAQQASNKAHERKVKYQRHREIPYTLGAAVFLLNNAAMRSAHMKFADKWIGPFRVIRRCGEVNYEIQRIHSPQRTQVVHANRLKMAHLREDAPYLSAAVLPLAIPVHQEQETIHLVPSTPTPKPEDESDVTWLITETRPARMVTPFPPTVRGTRSDREARSRKDHVHKLVGNAR